MVRVKVKGGGITKFLKAWDKEVYDLNKEIKKLHLKKRTIYLTKEKKVYV